MTIDERLERLTERHEALAESLGLMRTEGEQTAARIRALATFPLKIPYASSLFSWERCLASC